MTSAPRKVYTYLLGHNIDFVKCHGRGVQPWYKGHGGWTLMVAFWKAILAWWINELKHHVWIGRLQEWEKEQMVVIFLRKTWLQLHLYNLYLLCDSREVTTSLWDCFFTYNVWLVKSSVPASYMCWEGFCPVCGTLNVLSQCWKSVCVNASVNRGTWVPRRVFAGRQKGFILWEMGANHVFDLIIRQFPQVDRNNQILGTQIFISPLFNGMDYATPWTIS